MRNHLAWVVVALLGMLASASLFATDTGTLADLDQDKTRPAWGYSGATGPSYWGDLTEAFRACKVGDAQSPIDISAPRQQNRIPLHFEYRSSSLYIVNDGRTIKVLYEPGSYLRIGKHRYELKRLDFHTPSEHRINGQAADMELHLTHEDQHGNIVVVAALYQVGRRENIILSRLWENMPPRPGERLNNRRVGIKANFLLPTNRSVFAYRGSLTTPPCTEGVEWYVFRTPLEISRHHLQQFQQVIGSNARPPQPVNGRPIVTSR